MKGNVINLNTLHLNSVRLNGIGKVQSVSLKGGSTEDPVFPPVEPPVEPTPTYTLSASVTNGMVSAKRNGSAVNLPFTANEGDTIVLEVTPNDGYTFEGWNDGNTDNPRSITMNADVVLSAQCVEVVQPPVGKYIQFEDKAVERVLMSKGVSSDGIGITMEDAAAVTDISTWFRENKDITSFDELQYFTGVVNLRDYAFDNCTNLQRIYIRHIKSIGHAVFRACSSLDMDVDMPYLTGSLGVMAFHNTKIRSFSAPLLSEIMGYSPSQSTFMDCLNLTRVYAPSVVSVGSWVFCGDTALVDVIFSDSLQKVGEGTFWNCTALKSYELGAAVTEINNYAFKNCSSFEQFICRAITPPTLGVNVFDGSYPIYVPDASLEAYKTATNWNQYADRIHPLSEIEGSPYIQFEDAEVERVLMANGVSSDGIGITKEDAASVTSISTWFKGNTAMTSFNELKYFINVKALSTSYAFSGCTNLQRVNLENIESMNSQVFNNSGIVELILPKIKSLINSALVGMKSITKVVIGASCESIEPNNIWSWGDRNSVAFILEGTTPPSVATSNNKPDWYGVKFYVPDEAVEVYKAATGWASWAGRIYPVSEYNG